VTEFYINIEGVWWGEGRGGEYTTKDVRFGRNSKARSKTGQTAFMTRQPQGIAHKVKSKMVKLQNPHVGVSKINEANGRNKLEVKKGETSKVTAKVSKVKM
jgi:hypothetical protein